MVYPHNVKKKKANRRLKTKYNFTYIPFILSALFNLESVKIYT